MFVSSLQNITIKVKKCMYVGNIWKKNLPVNVKCVCVCVCVCWNLTFRGPWIMIYSHNKNKRCTDFLNLFFWNRTLNVSDGFSVRHQESITVHTTISVCHTGYADSLRAGSGWDCSSILIPLASCQHNLYDK